MWCALLLAAPALTHVRFATPTRPPLVRMQQPAAAPIRMQQPAVPPSTLQALTFPCLSLAAAASGLAFPRACAPLGSLPALQAGMSALMLSMGLSLTPADLRRALASPREIVLNAALCFGAMPLVAVALAHALGLPAATAAGLVLLGSVSGGQASNLCALLAGGDLALSVVLTVSTTVLGVVATPALVQLLLGATVAVDAAAMLGSIARLVLLPLAAGLAAGQYLPALVARLQPSLPRLGVAALLGLVAGGSANAASLLLGAAAWRAHAASILLPLVGGAVALAIAAVARLDGRAARTLSIETAIKSPTLAFVLAQTHFESAAVAAVPAASMVWLAAIGAAAASAWRHLAPRSD